jgi:hypothetical protein
MSPTPRRLDAAIVCVAQKISGIHNGPLQNREHGAGAFDLGDNAVVCVVGPSSAVVAAGHGCGMDGVDPSGRRSFRPGLEVNVDFPKPSWHRSMHHGTVIGDGDASASTDKARCAVSNTEGRWQLDALPGLLPPFRNCWRGRR